MDSEEKRTQESAAAEEQSQPPEEGGQADSQEELRRALEEQRARAEGYLANWQRAQADLANFKRRTEQERGEVARYTGAPVFANLLPIVDDLERALASIPVQIFTLTWADGIRLIHHEFLAMLESHGVQQIPAQDQDFDPRYHQSVMQGAGPEGKVITEFQKGYRLHDRVLRPSLVQVGDGTGETTQAPEAAEAEGTGEAPEALDKPYQSGPAPDGGESTQT